VPPVPVISDDAHRSHDPPFELNTGERVSPVHEHPGRIDAIAASLEAAGHPFLDRRSYGDSLLTTVHDPDMVAFLRDGHAAWRAAGGPEVMIADTFRSPRYAGGGRPTASPIGKLGWWCFDTATPIVAGTYTAARAAVDVALTAADRLIAGTPAIYGLTRPPGHHAGRDYFGGFCFFNHAAVAASHLKTGGRVAVLDLDVHHGNGTQDLFWRDPEVLYVSLHGHPDHLYPYFSGFAEEVGEGPGRGTTRNLPLGPGTGDHDFLTAVTIALELVTSFAPAAVVVSLGFDAFQADPIGSLALTLEGYAAIGRHLGELGLPLLLLQEGGYATDRLGELAAATLAGVADVP
jgi:acetoin utilization deacetylase AcuC-like enzyme